MFEQYEREDTTLEWIDTMRDTFHYAVEFSYDVPENPGVLFSRVAVQVEPHGQGCSIYCAVTSGVYSYRPIMYTEGTSDPVEALEMFINKFNTDSEV